MMNWTKKLLLFALLSIFIFTLSSIFTDCLKSSEEILLSNVFSANQMNLATESQSLAESFGEKGEVGIKNPYLIKTFIDDNGRQIDEIIVPGVPPKIKAKPVNAPESNPLAGVNVLSNVPAFYWSYGCSATSAAILFGYYDNHGFPNMYTGPTNGGVCPMDNSTWGTTTYPSVTSDECPLSATHQGVDGRTTRGHVDDYWIDYGNAGPDPYIVNSWAEHIQGECTGDFMGTNQSKYGNSDGSTTFYFDPTGSPLYDYTEGEPSIHDGCHGLRLFAESRGYTVDTNFSQYIKGQGSDPNKGFTFDDFKNEIDAGRLVLIQVTGHTMLGYGYNTTSQIIYIHDTWDQADHQMMWGGTHSGLQHYGVTITRLHPPLTITTQSIPNGIIGISCSQTLQATGGTGSYTWQIILGLLPPGLSLNSSTGTIWGTPVSANTYNFTIQVSDGTQTATKDFSIVITAADADTGGMQYANWYFGQKDLKEVNILIQINSDLSLDDGIYFQAHDGYINGNMFYFGLQTLVGKPGYPSPGKGLIFSEFGTTDSSNIRTAPGGWYEIGTYEGPFISTRLSYAWTTHKYILTIKYKESDSIGDWYEFWINDLDSNIETYAGALRFPYPADPSKTGITDYGGTWTELYSRKYSGTPLPVWSVSILEVSSISNEGSLLFPVSAHLKNADNFYHIDQIFYPENNGLDFLMGGDTIKSFDTKDVTLSTGTISVVAKLDGINWSGNLNFKLQRENTYNFYNVPANLAGYWAGNYKIAFISGGPPNASLASITPSPAQTLTNGGLITFNLNFASPPPPILTLIQPNGGESLTVGNTYPIQFSLTGDTSHTNISYFVLYFTVDGGASYERIAYVPFDPLTTTYTYNWTVPTRITTLAKVIVYARKADATTLAYDVSDDYFSILDPAHTGDFTVTVTNPPNSSTVTPGTDCTITWTTSGTQPSDLAYYALYVSYENGRNGSWQRLGYADKSLTSFVWHVPSNVRSDYVKILVYPRNASAGTVGQTTPVTFRVAPPSYNFTITFNHPSSSEILHANTTYTLDLTISNIPPELDHYIYYITMDNGASWEPLTVNPDLSFTVPYRISTECKIMIVAVDSSSTPLQVQISPTFTIAP